MADRKEKKQRKEDFRLEDYKPLNGRLLITLDSDVSLLSGDQKASILDFQKVVAVSDNDLVKVGDIVLLDIDSLISRYPEKDEDGKMIMKESLKIPAIQLGGKTYGEIRFVNIRGCFKKN